MRPKKKKRKKRQYNGYVKLLRSALIAIRRAVERVVFGTIPDQKSNRSSDRFRLVHWRDNLRGAVVVVIFSITIVVVGAVELGAVTNKAAEGVREHVDLTTSDDLATAGKCTLPSAAADVAGVAPVVVVVVEAHVEFDDFTWEMKVKLGEKVVDAPVITSIREMAPTSTTVRELLVEVCSCNTQAERNQMLARDEKSAALEDTLFWAIESDIFMNAAIARPSQF
ncbi:hypothetical protein ON010_g9217 [Phytophthora cinnamomi]|nr:hypothetical protein ON010_g9217 [Phytophthora cinnamomi]